MSDTKHTPTPELLAEHGRLSGELYAVNQILDDLDDEIDPLGFTSMTTRRNDLRAELKATQTRIAKCVNAHDELVAALEDALEMADYCQDGLPEDYPGIGEVNRKLAAARAALAKVKPQTVTA